MTFYTIQLTISSGLISEKNAVFTGIEHMFPFNTVLFMNSVFAAKCTPN